MKKAFLQLHLAVFLAGFTGVLGKFIQLNEGLLVWYRLLISSVTLWVICLIRRSHLRISMTGVYKIFGVGAIAALHWVCFYGSIKYSNVSISLVCFSSIGFFTALLEPLFFRVRPDRTELLLGLLVILGIYFIFQFDPHYKTGIILGMLSALLGSIFPVCNRILLRHIPPETVTVYELTGGFLFLSLLLPAYLQGFPTSRFLPSWSDWLGLLVLSWLCTVFAFSLSMRALRKISAFTVNLSFNLEPVYGILLAFAFFGENRNFGWGFYLGFTLILLSIILQMSRLALQRGNKAKQGQD
jgi:drug/metabolite transporter (DMT)-like permease